MSQGGPGVVRQVAFWSHTMLLGRYWVLQPLVQRSFTIPSPGRLLSSKQHGDSQGQTVHVGGGLWWFNISIEIYWDLFYSKKHYDYLNIIASIVSHRIDPFPMDLGGKHHPRPLPRNVPAVVQVPCGATGHRHQAALRLVHVVYGQLRRRKHAWRKRVLDEWWRQGQKP